MSTRFGEVSEWLKEHAWKACIRSLRIKGSNPFLTAITFPYFKGKNQIQGSYFLRTKRTAEAVFFFTLNSSLFVFIILYSIFPYFNLL